MEDPVSEIPQVIRNLTQTPPSLQRATIERYFTPSASFIHPFCRTGSFNGSRWLIWCIYRWYKIMSPHIDITIDSVAFDKSTLRLYVSISQIFRIWFIPFHSAPASLVTVLRLQHDRPSNRYYIRQQQDLYEPDECAKFFSVFRVVWLFTVLWQFVATGFCVAGAMLGGPVSWVEENAVGGNREKSVREVVLG